MLHCTTCHVGKPTYKNQTFTATLTVGFVSKHKDPKTFLKIFEFFLRRKLSVYARSVAGCDLLEALKGDQNAEGLPMCHISRNYSTFAVRSPRHRTSKRTRRIGKTFNADAPTLHNVFAIAAYEELAVRNATRALANHGMKPRTRCSGATPTRTLLRVERTARIMMPSTKRVLQENKRKENEDRVRGDDK